jgi:hypothetical protein
MAAFSKLGQFGSLGNVVCGVAYVMQVDGLRIPCPVLGAPCKAFDAQGEARHAPTR